MRHPSKSFILGLVLNSLYFIFQIVWWSESPASADQTHFACAYYYVNASRWTLRIDQRALKEIFGVWFISSLPFFDFSIFVFAIFFTLHNFHRDFSTNFTRFSLNCFFVLCLAVFKFFSEFKFYFHSFIQEIPSSKNLQIFITCSSYYFPLVIIISIFISSGC